jgi:hypothetical protein
MIAAVADPATRHAGRAGRAAFVAAAAVAGATSVTALRRWDPEVVGWYPPCPTRLLTGLDCPGCGSLRGLHDLANGDVLAAADHNLLLVVAVAWLAVVAVRLLLRARPHGAGAARAWLVAVAVFTVARNLPLVPFLPSG